MPLTRMVQARTTTVASNDGLRRRHVAKAMAEGAPQILELRLGRGDPSAVMLDFGVVVDPTSFGTAGMWRIDAPGVLDVHGYFYFDGKSLFVQSADDKAPLMVNKHRVATAWTEVRAPSTIEVGKAELVYRDNGTPSYDDGDATLAAATAPLQPRPKPAFVPGGGAFVNRADDESTRFAPIDGMPQPARLPDPLDGNDGIRAPLARPAAGNPAMAFPPPQMEMSSQPMPMGMQGTPPGMHGMQGMPPGMHGMPGHPGMQGMPPGMQGMPGHPGMQGWNGGAMPTGGQPTIPGQLGELKGWEKFKAEWRVLPPIRRALYIMAPFVFSAACFLLFFDDPPAAPAAKPVKPSTSASTAGSGSITAGTPSTTGSGSVSAGSSSAAGFAAVAAGSAPTSTVSAGGTAAIPSTTTPTPSATAASSTATTPPEIPPHGNSGPSAPPSPPSKRTMERAAADAWAEGNYPEAAKLYDTLAEANPGNPAYKEASRMLHEKMSAPPGHR